MKAKRILCLLLSLIMVLSLMPYGVVRADETGAVSAGEGAAATDTPERGSENASCEQCGLPISAEVDDLAVSSPLHSGTAAPMSTGVSEPNVRPAPFANSDVEANTDQWTFRVDSDSTGKLVRETHDFRDRTDITDYPVEQVCNLGDSLYALFVRDGVYVIAEMDLDTMQWTDLLAAKTPILRFAVTEDTLYYLTEETIAAYSLADHAAATVFSEAGLCRFWLLTDTVLEYIAGDETIVWQYDLQTGEKGSYANQISVLEEADPGAVTVNGLGISGLRSKFPAGKYWNHAGNPGSSNSVNNQNGYTSTPCSVHGVVGTSRQTCNGFQPGSTQLSWQCMGYAEKLGYDVTGYNPRNNANGWYTNSSSSALNSLKAGDIVRYKNNGHSIYIIGVNGDTVTYTDCNSDGHCVIRWDATISKSTLASTFSYVRSAPSGLSPEPETCTCSTSYAGNYTCTTASANLNMRSGHGTGYSIVTAIPSGATVYVSKANGTWAHVEYNGYSGYASMQYLTKQSTSASRNSAISIWMSDTEMGSGIGSIRTGEWLYLCYKIYDKNTGDLFDSYNTSGYTVKVTLYEVDGSVAHTATYSNDESWISIRRNVPGVYRGEVVFAYNSGGTTTVTNSIDMVYEPRVSPSPSDISLNVLGVNSETITISYSGATNSNSIYLNASSTGDCFTYTWGSWSNHQMPLTVTGTKGGTGSITIYLRDSDTDEVLATSVVNIRVEAPSYTVSYNANGGSGAPSSQTKDYGVNLALSSTVPTRFGYNFLGWSTSSTATSPSYYSGDTYSANSGATLYAVWGQPSEISGNYAGFTRSATINNGGAGVYYKFIPYTTTYYRIYGIDDLDTRVYLYDASGNQLGANDDGGEDHQFQLDYYFTAGSVYYIYVRYYGSSQTGTLDYKIAYGYRINYNANGGTGAPSTTYKYYNFDTTLSETVPTKSGASFLGWATSSSAATAEYRPGDVFSENTNATLYAVWKQDLYTVSYNANGGTGAPASQSKTGGTALTLSTTQPTRFGYTFLGWSTSSTATSATYLPGGSFTTDANTTLYAVWQSAASISSGVTNSSYSASIPFANASKYFSFTPSFTGTVRFESTGSSDTRIYLYDTNGNQLTSDDDSGDGNNFMLTYSVTSGTKYYAKVAYYGSGTGTISFTVKRAYNITFNANGGSGAPGTQLKIHGTSLTLSSTVPTRSGYTFLGWATSSGAASAAYQPGSSFTTDANTTLYAVWKRDLYTVSYNANGGTGAPASQTKTSGTALTLSTTQPTRFGYTFLGWSTSSTATSASYLPGGSFTTDANTTLYAVWQSAASISSGVTNSSYSASIPFANASKYFSFTPSFTGTVRFESTGSSDTRIYLYDTNGNQLATDDDSGDGNNFMLTHSVTSGTKYYAKVAYYGSGTGTISFTVKRAYNITFNANGGSGAPGTQLKIHGTSLTLSSTVPTRSGYTFLGWATSSGAASAAYQPGSSFTTDANTTLYALWEANCDNGHSYTYAVTRTPTTAAAGTLTGTCSRCSGTTTVTLPKLNTTDYSYSVTKAATCTAAGTGRYTWKTVIYGSYYFNVTIAATGHDYEGGSCIHCGAQDPDASAAVIASGWSGATEWTLTDDGVLTVYGSGNMKNYGYSDKRPWESYAQQITAVVVESGVTSIGECAFKGLTRLENVMLRSGSLTKIGEAAFYGCSSLCSITIPEGIYTIWSYTFKNCSELREVNLPKTLIKIDQGAFENCTSLPYIYIPTEVEIIGSWSFKGCTSLAEADMTWADATKIREGAFKNCASLTTIRMPGNIQTLGDSCFYGIGAASFTVPATVTSIEAWCFARAHSLKTITFEGSAPTIGQGAFNKIYLTAYYPSGNATWTASVRLNYGGSVIWMAN